MTSSPDARRRAEDLVVVAGVTVRFGDREVLSGAGLSVGRGEIVTLIGPNGAGKTTLLRVVLGLLRPQTGAVVVTPGLRVGYMPQRMVVDASLPLSVRRFLELAGRAARGRVSSVLAEVGATATLDAPLRGVSGGEMQRVLLARALLRDPDLLVLDEPVQGVDVQGQVDLFDLIARLRDERGCGVLMVSHDLHLVMARADRVVCLNRSVCCTGTPALVSREPAYLSLFRGAASSGLAPYAHTHAAETGPGPGPDPGGEGEASPRG